MASTASMPVTTPGPAPASLPARRWEAQLQLGYERRGERTVLARRAHRGPLRVQRALYPEGPALCHTLVVHPPGGVAGGDDLWLDVQVDAGAAALLTTPGAGKWYRGHGHRARQRVTLDVAAGGALEWLPQESILFDGAEAELSCRVRLAEGAAYLGWEILCLGRQAAGERFTEGELRLTTELWRRGSGGGSGECVTGAPGVIGTAGDQRLWLERGRLAGGDPLLTSPVGLAGFPVCATLLAASPTGAPSPQQLIAACRAVDEYGGTAGVTCLPGGILIARWLGERSEAARHYLVALWRLLRPALFCRAAISPRIWAT
jgi:urease accessory protein